MAVQTFGNRILGGVGAPGGGMSETFAAGVNTALSQRTARQGMVGEAQRQRLLEQEFSWKGEDREEAKRRRAAAAAEAAAARARGIAAIEGLRSAEPFFRFGAASTTAPATAAPAPRTGVGTSFPLGVAAPTVSGGAGSTSVTGDPRLDRLGATGPSFETGGRGQPAIAGATGPSFETGGRGQPESTFNRFTLEQLTNLGARPGDFAAQATQDRLGAPRAATSRADIVAGLPANINTTDAIPRMRQRQEFLKERIKAEIEERQNPSRFRLPGSRVDIDAARAEIEQLDRDIALAGMTPGDIDVRGVTAEEGPGVVTIQGPNGPVTVPTASDGAATAGVSGAGGTVNPLLPQLQAELAVTPVTPTAPGDLSFAGVAAMGTETSTPLGFGPRLGAAPTPTEQFLSAVGAAPAGQVDLATLASSYDSPLYDPMFSQLAEQQRAAFAYAAEYAASRGDIAGYIEATAKVREQEMMILTQQLVVGIDEATYFNSPQRLSAVASMVYGGQNIFIAPKGDGTADIYQDNELVRSGADLNEFASGLRSLIDAEYRNQMATTAAERDKFVFEKQTEADIAAQRTIDEEFGKALTAIQVEQLRSALIANGQLPPPAAENEFREGPNGEIVVLNKNTGERVTSYIFGVDEATGQTTIKELRP